MNASRFCALAIALLYLTSGSLPHQALTIPNDPTLYVNPATSWAICNGSFTVEVSICDALNVFAWEFRFGWNASVLNVTSFAEGNFLKGLEGASTYFINKTYQDNIDIDYILLGCTRLGHVNGVDGSGTLATITFFVEDKGETDLDLFETKLRDSVPNPINHVVEDGYFTNVVAPPTPFFTCSPSIAFAGYAVTLDASESYDYDGQIVSWEWSFGDGESGTGVTTPHVYLQPGQYLVSLKVTDNSSISNALRRELRVVTYTVGPVHNINTLLDYATIQAAINAPETVNGHVIGVDNGTYTEEVDVTKAVTLIGESKDAVIQGTVDIKNSKITIQGFTIQGTILAGSPWVGTTSDVVIRDNHIENGGIVISAGFVFPYPFSNVTIEDNYILNASTGISVTIGEGNRIIGNTLIGNKIGIFLGSNNNTVLDNRVESGGVGIHVDSFNNTLANNVMRENTWNFGFGRAGAYPNTIDTSNLINDRPIYLIMNQSNIQVDPYSHPYLGYLALINCRNITVRDLNLSGNGQGILLQGGEDNDLLNNDLVDNVVGIMVVSSDRNELASNTVSDNGLGIWLIESGMNTILDNELQNNTLAIFGGLAGYLNPSIYGKLSYSFGWASGALVLFYSPNNSIIGNTLVNSDFGIFLARSGSNTLRDNIIAGNVFNFAIDEWANSGFVQDIDDSNIINGKPIIYWVNEHMKQVPQNAGYVTLVNCSDITIADLDICDNLHGILVVSSNNSLISDNRISNCSAGILVRQSSHSIDAVFRPFNVSTRFNTITGCGVGISLFSGEKHTISSNSLYGNLAGIYIRYDKGNIISNNIVKNSTISSLDWRIRMDPRRIGRLDAWWWYSPVMFLPGCVGISVESSNNTLVGNTLAYNEIGLAVGVMTRQGNNTIYHNSFVNNSRYQAFSESSNIWDDGYPSGGNYWSNYNGGDTNGDGIGDASYPINTNSFDKYPLMGPSSTFSAGTWNSATYSVDAVSNSTLSNFNFNQPEKLISFDVTGANGTSGFCRATIPNAMLGGPYAILVDGVPPTVLNQISNGTCTFLYFTYDHSARHVTIVGATAVPEFPPFIIFPLLLASILLAALISEGTRSRNGGVGRKEDEK